MTGQGRRRRNVPNASQRAHGTSIAPKRPTTLPPQYDFTPPAVPDPRVQSPVQQPRIVPQHSTSAVHVRDYPPPQQLFMNSQSQSQPRQRQASEEVRQPTPQQPTPHQPQPEDEAPPSPHSHLNSDGPSVGHSQPYSSQGNNFMEFSPMLPELEEETLQALNDLLQVPDRDQFTTVLSPTPRENTTWFTRDVKSRLVRKITKIFKNKFDGPYYSWTCVPRERQERYFIEFAKTHTWDPLITGTVQWWFEEICQRRMKNMVSTARTKRKKPKWIYKDIWAVMVAYWDTEEAQQRSETYSKVRMSDRNGLGPHIHLSGPKSYQQIQDELEEQLGRPVSLGEVFIKTHTKADGTYVDGKAEKIAKIYEANVQAKLSELEVETSSISDGASRVRELTADECTAIFLQSTEKDSRGTLYGVGSLKGILRNGKRKQPGDSSSFVAMQEQLKEAQRKIEEQAAENAIRDAAVAAREKEHSRTVAEQKDKLEHLSLVEKYLRQTDPAFLDFIQSHSAPATTEPVSNGLTPTP